MKPFQGIGGLEWFPLGSSFLATQGCLLQSLQDWKLDSPTIPSTRADCYNPSGLGNPNHEACNSAAIPLKTATLIFYCVALEPNKTVGDLCLGFHLMQYPGLKRRKVHALFHNTGLKPRC